MFKRMRGARTLMRVFTLRKSKLTSIRICIVLAAILIAVAAPVVYANTRSHKKLAADSTNGKITSTSSEKSATQQPQTLAQSQTSDTTSSTSSASRQTSTTSTTPNQIGISQNKLSISVSTTYLAFRIGSGSSLVTAKTDDGSSVAWTVNCNGFALTPHGSATPSSQYSFTVDSLFPNTKPGTYAISLDAFNPHDTAQHASRTITVELQPQFTFDIVIDTANITTESSGKYIPFHTVATGGTPGTIITGGVTVSPAAQYAEYYYVTSSSMTGADHGYILVNVQGTAMLVPRTVTVTFTAYSGAYSKTVSFPLSLP